MHRCALALITVGVTSLIARPAVACEQPGNAECETAPASGLDVPLMARFEIGTFEDRAWIDAMSGEDEWGQYTGMLPVPGVVESRGLLMRASFGLGGGYGGVEMGLGRIRSAPPVIGTPDPAVWDFIDAEDGPGMGNSVFVGRVIGGVEQRLGFLSLGAELALGGVATTVGETDIGSPFVSDARFVLDARARLGIWLSPHINVNVLLGTSLIRDGERTLGAMLGLTPFRFDSL